MTITFPSINEKWTGRLVELLTQLKPLFQTSRPLLSVLERADLEKLEITSERLLHLFKNAPQDDRQGLHKLRNLVGALRGYSELICEDFDRVKTPELLQHLQQLGKHSSEIDLSQPPHSESDEFDSDIQSHGVILAVDDTEENRDLLSRYLQRNHHEVITASSGQEALEILDTTPVDAILLDLIMPEMDGHEVLRRVKANEALRAIPVIVISGLQDTPEIIRCIEAGADDYLFKPFNAVLLQARIQAGLERKRWHDKEQAYREQLEKSQRFIRHTFGRYVSDEIVENLLEKPEGLKLGGDQREVTILMADIRSFTTICEQLDPGRVVKLLNIYLGAMSEIIIKHLGTIDEFIGDAILAIFGAPTSRQDDTERALKCALEMQQAITAINKANLLEDLPEISIGIAINTGSVIAGNIGSERRSKYGVVGHTVNLTARIEDHSRAGEILISESTLKTSKHNLSIGRSECVSVRGINEPLNIYQLLGFDDKSSSDTNL